MAVWTVTPTLPELRELVEATWCVDYIESFAADVPGADVDRLDGMLAVIEVMEERALNDHKPSQREAATEPRTVKNAITQADLPEWTESAGGREKWRAWMERRVTSFSRRAKKWKELSGAAETVPTKAEWRRAILVALTASKGQGYFSKWPLSLDFEPTDGRYPSVDHLVGPWQADVALEIRVVNDMKTILSVEEFRKMVGHLSKTLDASVELAEPWEFKRDFAGEQADEEPPF